MRGRQRIPPPTELTDEQRAAVKKYFDEHPDGGYRAACFAAGIPHITRSEAKTLIENDAELAGYRLRSMRRPRFSGAKARATRHHCRLERIAERDFGGGILIEPFGWNHRLANGPLALDLSALSPEQTKGGSAMQNITVGRYSEPHEDDGYAGWIEPDDKSWLLFVKTDHSVEMYLNRDPETGAVL